MRHTGGTAQPAKARTQITIAALMFVLSTISYFDRTIMSIVAPVVIREFAISETQMGAVFSAFIISYAAFQAPGGRLADRFGPRLVLTFAGLGAALFTGLTALGGRPGLGSLIEIVPSFLIVRLAFGACTAPLYPACGKMVAAWFPERSHARLQALIISGAPVGSAISPVLFSRLIGSHGWRRSFWMAAGATAVAVGLWFVLVRDRHSRSVQGAAPDGSQAPEACWHELLTDRTLLLLTTGYFCLSYFESIFFYWIYYYFGEIRQIGTTRSAIYVTILFLAMAIMLPLGGWASDRLVLRHGRKVGRRTVPFISMTLSAVLLYVGVSGVGTFATVSFLSLALGLAASSEGVFWGSAIDIGGRQVGAVCGILNTGGNLGAILGPIVTPFIAKQFGWTWGLYFGSIIVFVGVLVWFFIDPTRTINRNSRLSSVPNQR